MANNLTSLSGYPTVAFLVKRRVIARGPTKGRKMKETMLLNWVVLNDEQMKAADTELESLSQAELAELVRTGQAATSESTKQVVNWIFATIG